MISCLLVVVTGRKNAIFHLGSHACLHRQDRSQQPGISFSQISIDACIPAHCRAGKLAAVPPIWRNHPAPDGTTGRAAMTSAVEDRLIVLSGQLAQ
jgi:hypothetical protein